MRQTSDLDSALLAVSSAGQNFLVITAHDFRSSRKANIHFIIDELKKLGQTRVFSVGFSALSKFKSSDPRHGLESRANRIEPFEGVSCYLWRTLVHPFNPRLSLLQKFSPLAFRAYRHLVPPILREWTKEATTILIESGMGVFLIEELRQWNRSATVIYVASDDMQTIGVDPYLVEAFSRFAKYVDFARVPSRKLAPVIPKGLITYYVPHGIDLRLDEQADPSPYGPGKHAVSVGSMLFDPAFFRVAIEAFPDVTFHVIGSGAPRGSLPPTVIDYGEMPFRQTIPYIKHALFGIAPYRKAEAPYYLCDTSMKLIQYGFLALPAVCSQFAAGNGDALRFGYEPGDRDSICRAIAKAMVAPHIRLGQYLSWSDVTSRLLCPSAFADTIV